MSTIGENPSSPTKQHLVSGTQFPRNSGEKLYFEKYGTVTPIPERTMRRKNAIQVCSILYIHQGTPLKEACRLASVDHCHIKQVSADDKWDEFQQDLAQLTRPSNLTLVKAHDFAIVSKEHARREKSLKSLQRTEDRIVKGLDEVVSGSREEATLITNLTKIRLLIGDVTGYNAFTKEMSAARQAGLTASAKNAPATPQDPKMAKGTIIEL